MIVRYFSHVIDSGVQACARMKILRFALLGYVIDSGVQDCAQMQILDQKPTIRSKGHKITFKLGFIRLSVLCHSKTECKRTFPAVHFCRLQSHVHQIDRLSLRKDMHTLTKNSHLCEKLCISSTIVHILMVSCIY